MIFDGLICSFRILRAPVCPITSLKDALISNANLCWERHALLRSESLEEEPLMTWKGYFAYRTLDIFRFPHWWDRSRTESEHQQDNQWPVIKKSYMRLVMHLINTRLGAFERQTSSKIKRNAIWTSTACLSGTHKRVALVGPWSYRMQFLQQPIGV